MELSPGWLVPSADLEVRYARSRGPGGQNVNKVETKVIVRLKLSQTSSLNPGQKRRLARVFPAHVSSTGDFIVSADRFRSRNRNRRDALERLATMLRSIRRPPRPRVATKPSQAVKARRLEQKRKRGELKKQRRAHYD